MNDQTDNDTTALRYWIHRDSGVGMISKHPPSGDGWREVSRAEYYALAGYASAPEDRP